MVRMQFVIEETNVDLQCSPFLVRVWFWVQGSEDRSKICGMG